MKSWTEVDEDQEHPLGTESKVSVADARSEHFRALFNFFGPWHVFFIYARLQSLQGILT